MDSAIPQGVLPPGSPLQLYLATLQEESSLGGDGQPQMILSALDPDRHIYLVEETESGWRVVCKFFAARPDLPLGECRNLLQHEYRCLQSLRPLGFDRPPCMVVRPWGKMESLGCLLAEEFVNGRSLDYYIDKACREGQEARLMGKLRLVAQFMATLHRCTGSAIQPNFSRSTGAFRAMVRLLLGSGLLDRELAGRLVEEAVHWEAEPRMWPGASSRVHGDATPTNFIFHRDGVTAIDLERMHVADPAYDIGMVMAELKHHFALRTLQADRAEPFIGEFLRYYVETLGQGNRCFEDLCFRGRFYMALGELRIARNEWLPTGHRCWLAEEALRCLS